MEKHRASHLPQSIRETVGSPSSSFSDPDALYRTKSDGVFKELRRWILIGRLEPGERLDQEWLALQLHVSRMPLRHALLKLERDGLIENKPHRGAIVAPLSLAALEDIYAARRALETMLAEVAAARVNRAVLDRMATYIKEQEQAIKAGNIETYVELDRGFHSELYRASGYVRACEILDRLRDSSDRYIRFYARDRRAAAISISDHRQILKECENSRPGAVRRTTEKHISDGLAVLMKLVKYHEERVKTNRIGEPVEG